MIDDLEFWRGSASPAVPRLQIVSTYLYVAAGFQVHTATSIVSSHLLPPALKPALFRHARNTSSNTQTIRPFTGACLSHLHRSVPSATFH